MKENKTALYFYMMIGSIGTLLIALSAIRYIESKEFNTEYLMILWGFILTMSYINFLEKKAGIRKKFTWIRAIVSIIILFAVGLTFYL